MAAAAAATVAAFCGHYAIKRGQPAVDYMASACVRVGVTSRILVTCSKRACAPDSVLLQ